MGKEKSLLLILILFIFNLNAQSQIEKGSYQFTTNIIDDYSELMIKKDSVNDEDTVFEIYKGSKITVVGMSKDQELVYIKYWEYNEKTKKRKHFYSIRKTETKKDNPKAIYNDKIFQIPSQTFEKITRPLYERYKGTNVGVYTVPFRLRGVGDNFDFESSLSLQANIVAGFGKQTIESSWIDLSLGIGLTAINLNSNNSNVTDQRTASAFTISSGFVVKPSKFANLGIFIGIDNLGVNDRDTDWIHNGDLWLGLGINISFNAITTNQSANGNGNNDDS